MMTDFSLESAGVAEKDLRKQVLAAVRKAGYKAKPSGKTAGSNASRGSASSSTSAAKAGSSKDDVSSCYLIAPLHNSFSRIGASISVCRPGLSGNAGETMISTNCCQVSRPRTAMRTAV